MIQWYFTTNLEKIKVWSEKFLNRVSQVDELREGFRECYASINISVQSFITIFTLFRSGQATQSYKKGCY